MAFEEGTWAARLYDLLQPHVARVLACDPRKNALLKAGNKSDRIDACKLSELLYLNKLNSVYHGEQGIRTLKERARSYTTITRDLTRVMSRLKAIYRSWGIPCRVLVKKHCNRSIHICLGSIDGSPYALNRVWTSVLGSGMRVTGNPTSGFGAESFA